MSSSKFEDPLEHFQNFGDPNALLEFVSKSGRNLQDYRAAVDILSPIFQALSLKRQPNYETLNQSALQQRNAEVENIVKWMVESEKADMKTIALEVMGFLGWEAFRSDLEHSLVSGAKWERLTAIKALRQITDRWAVETLKIVSGDTDPEIQDAIRQA